MTLEREVQRAAGGLLRRRMDGELRLAVIYRNRYGGDLTLPKGKLEPGEGWEEAALREVREETGCEAALRRVAEPITYRFGRTIKVVVYFFMDFQSEAGLMDPDEVDEVRWLTPAEARRRLTYDDERELVRRMFDG